MKIKEIIEEEKLRQRIQNKQDMRADRKGRTLKELPTMKKIN